MNAKRQQFLLFRVYTHRDTTAYGELYDAYYDSIRRYLFFKLPTSADTDELTAEVFLRAWEYATASKVSFAGALFYRIAGRLIADFYRKRKPEDSLDSAADVRSKTDIEAEYDRKDQGEKLAKAIRMLKEEYREIIILRFLNEMSIKEIARIREKTPNNIRVTLYRAKRALQRIIDAGEKYD
jgi:RNA polymerase sigma-70 factor (ECF subfamily)